MVITKTPRLILRQLATSDAPFILKLVNEPLWLQFIGDKKVKTIDAAVSYLLNGPLRSYRINGFGLWLVTLQETHVPIGMCGLIKRDILPNIDIGFAYLSPYHGQGYAQEAAAAVLAYAKDILKINRIVAIANQNNDRSISLLAKLGFHHEPPIILPGEEKAVAYMALNY